MHSMLLSGVHKRPHDAARRGGGDETLQPGKSSQPADELGGRLLGEEVCTITLSSALPKC